ncbi:MAG: PorV/PorQ family protein [Ignavibacteria bacterium]|nr:PorV/PorQ family protein [Ignavibacteria bacterium]
MKKIFLTLVLVSNLFAQNAANTGFSFLKIGSGAAEMSLAEATASKLSSPFSLNYNPALISQIDFSSIGLMHNEWIMDLSSEFLIGNTKVYGIPFFVTINSTKISDIEIRTRPGEAQGIFDAQYFFGGIGSGFEILNDLSVGFQFKYLYENIYVDEANGVAFDFGLFKKNLIQHFDAGLSLRNFGKVNQLSSERTELPMEFRFGISYSGELSTGKFYFLPSFEVQKYLKYEKLNLLFGLETNYDNLLSFRFGYNSGRDLNNFTFGVGVKYKFLSFDYAFLPFKENFGTANLISLYIKL